jgi:hypothetical protein
VVVQIQTERLQGLCRRPAGAQWIGGWPEVNRTWSARFARFQSHGKRGTAFEPGCFQGISIRPLRIPHSELRILFLAPPQFLLLPRRNKLLGLFHKMFSERVLSG